MKKTFGIIGYGRFGKLWARHLAQIGEVMIYDSKKITEPLPKNCTVASLQEVALCKMLFLAVPISKLDVVSKKIAKHLGKSTIVADVSSVKLFTAKILKKNLPKHQTIIGTHPLFGPDSVKNARTLSGFQIAVTPVNCSKSELKAFLSVLKKLHLDILMTTPRDHDRQMANSQGLIHFIGRGLEGLSLKPQTIATRDYGSLLHIKDMVVHDTWQLFLDMQRYNTLTAPVRRKFLQRLIDIEKYISKRETTTITSARKKIDSIDSQIIESIAERNSLVKKIGRLKKEQQQNITDNLREHKLKQTHIRMAHKLHVDGSVVDKIFSLLILHAKQIQKNEK